MRDEWAYARAYESNEERLAAFGPWLYDYDHHRPHTALGGLTPMEVFANNVSVNHSPAPISPAPRHLARHRAPA